MSRKRIILVGPTASGKNFIRDKFKSKGYLADVSYTTRKPREGEQYGVDYNFISDDEFTSRISKGAFYEHVKYGEFRYGTGLYEWHNYDIFIMETDGISKISEEDRKNCVILYVNTPLEIRMNRMRVERRWSYDKIKERIEIDDLKFKDFKDFDIQISSYS